MSIPQNGRGNSLGLAVGATNLAGTGNGQRPVIRPAAVTLDHGLTLTGFVDRVGDPVPMVAQDGSQHRAENLLADALDGLARSAANNAPVSEVAVAVPAYWRAPVVDALRAALRSKPGLSRSPLVSDATAAVTALRSNPGLPSAGVIVLCDFGGSGTSITLVDAAANDAPIGETVRLPDFSGDRIDQTILTKVVGGIFEAAGADPSGTAMVGSLSRLRDECRRAKERLSDETATAIAVDLPGLETNVRMTRMELDDLIAVPLDEFVAVLAETLDRSRVPLASVSAVATVGGGARIPLITQRLSEHLRAKVVTTARPQLTTAEGVALIAHRRQIVETATALAAAAPLTSTVAAAAFGAAAASPAVGALAWSEVEDGPEDLIELDSHFEDDYGRRPVDPRPDVQFTEHEWEDETPARRRVPVLLFGAAAAATVIAAAVFGLTALTRDTPTVPAGTSSSIAPAPAPVAAELPPPAAQAPAQAPAPEVATVVSQPQPQVAPQQPAAVQPAPQEPAAPAPEAPAPEVPAAPEAPAPEVPAAASPAPEAPAPAPAPESPAPPPSWTPPWSPPWRAPTNSGTGSPPVDPGAGGSGTGTGTGPGTGSSTGTGSRGTGAGTGDGEGAKTPARPGLVPPILEPLLTPQQ